MTNKLVKIDGYWMVLSDEEIQYKDNGKLVVDEYNKIHHLNENSFWRGRLIIASNKPEHHEGWLSPEKAPYNITFSEEVAKELGEVDVEKLAETNTYSKFDRVITGEIEDVKRKMFGRICNYEGFIDGYNQCKEDNKEKKYTEENLKFHINEFMEFCGKNYHYDAHFGWYEIGNPGHRPNNSTLVDEYVQSLKQEYEVEIQTNSDSITIIKLLK